MTYNDNNGMPQEIVTSIFAKNTPGERHAAALYVCDTAARVSDEPEVAAAEWLDALGLLTPEVRDEQVERKGRARHHTHPNARR